MPCSSVYRQRVARVAGSGLRVGRQGLFVTLTAQGSRAHDIRPGQRCRCTPEGGADLAEWNATAAARWNAFVKELSRYAGADVVTYDDKGRVHREMGISYFRAAEVQRRGALHFHVMMRRKDGAPLALRVGDVRRIAIKHGFGHEVDVQPVLDGHASYVAKYVAKSANDRREVPWAQRGYERPRNLCHRVHRRLGLVFDRRTGEIVGPATPCLVTTATFRTWSASRDWGDTMRAVRAAQQHWTLVMAGLPVWGRPEGDVWVPVRASSLGWGVVGPDRPDGGSGVIPELTLKSVPVGADV